MPGGTRSLTGGTQCSVYMDIPTGKHAAYGVSIQMPVNRGTHGWNSNIAMVTYLKMHPAERRSMLHQHEFHFAVYQFVSIMYKEE